VDLLPETQINSAPDSTGREMQRLISRLYPICRSMTGNGVRETLTIIRDEIPIEVREIPTGTRVFDWTVPKEWNIRDAYIKNSRGERIVDFRKSNLHVVNYSIPVKRTVRLDELKTHLFTLPEFPEWTPYRASFYKEDWGFCLPHQQYLQLEADEYEVCIDSSLADGHLTYGELLIPGATTDEIIISSHVCHPALCNDNLSGIAVSVLLAKYLSRNSSRYSYRFLFAPATIGSITWLSLNETNVARIKHGLVLACVGDQGNTTYKKSRRGNAEVDRAALHVLKTSGEEYKVMEFSPYGYDERQFSSPGFDLPVGCLMRSPYGGFPEYHTSADNLDFVKESSLADSLAKSLSILQVLEGNKTYLNQNPKCEPQLGKRGLYEGFGGSAAGKLAELAMLWVLNCSEGSHDLLAIAERAGLNFRLIKEAADKLEQHKLIKVLHHHAVTC
jgi:aminopeptidase-like protein